MRRTGVHRGLTLLATLVVLTIGSLAATIVLFAATGDVASGAALERRTQSRSLAWSGVLAAMQELSSQRGELLAGADPRLTRTWTLFETPSGARGVVRLREIGEEGALAQAEGAKLDLNSVDIETLASLPMVDGALAERILAARPRGGYESVESLVTVKGLTAELVLGSRVAPSGGGRGAVEGFGGVSGFPESGAFGGSTGSLTDEGGAGLVDLLTVFSFDPLVQAGLGTGGSEHAGAACISLGAEWTEELESLISERFDRSFAARVRGWIEGVVDSRGSLVGVLEGNGIPPREWGVYLDAFTTLPGRYAAGRVDINRASAAVLATLPGIEEETARSLVRARETLDEETLRSAAWPVSEGILTASQFREIADRVTTRCLQWRVVVEGGILPAGGMESGIGGIESLGVDPDAPLESPLVLEAVIDVAEPTPRVAYLREVTLLPVAASLAQQRDEEEETETDEGLGAGVGGGDGGLAGRGEEHGVGNDRLEPMEGMEHPMGGGDGGEPDGAAPAHDGGAMGETHEGMGGGHDAPEGGEAEREDGATRRGRWRGGDDEG